MDTARCLIFFTNNYMFKINIKVCNEGSIDEQPKKLVNFQYSL